MAISRFGTMFFDDPVAAFIDVDAAVDWVSGFASVGHVSPRLREALAAHLGPDGVRLGSRAWIVTAGVTSTSA